DPPAKLLERVASHDHPNRLTNPFGELLWVVGCGEAKLDGDQDGIAHPTIIGTRIRPGSVDVEASALERRGAGTVPLRRDRRDHRQQQVPQPRVVLLEHPDDLVMGDGSNVTSSDVVVRDERDVRVADLELSGQWG